jgi:membrane-associated protease RseP (regulator of RpoE activity)
VTSGLLAVLAVVYLSVLVHEGGHFVVARAVGMHPSAFFLGFGKTLWSFRRGSTEYGLKAIPLGGFVRIDGMTPKQVAALPEELRPRAFLHAGPARRAAVVAAGPAVNLLVGWMLLVGAALALGVPTGAAQVTQVSPGSPGAEAGVVVGDRLTIDAAGGGLVAVTVHQPDGRSRTLPAVPAQPDGQPQGLVTVPHTEHGVGAAVVEATSMTALGVAYVAQAVVHLPSLAVEAFAADRDMDGVMSLVGMAQLSGQAFDAGVGMWAVLLVAVSLNISLAALNLLPLPPLDGGHLATACMDGMRGQVARLRRRPAPAAWYAERFQPVTVTVMAGLLLLSVAIMIADVINPVRFPIG